MSSDAVTVDEGPFLDHPLEVVEVIHPDDPVGIVGIGLTARGGRESTADDDDIWIAALDRLVGKAEHLHIASGVNALSRIPLPVQVLLVPDLDGVDPSLVAVDEAGQEIGHELQIVGRGALRVLVRVTARPVGRIDDAEHHLQIALIGGLDDGVEATPVHLPRRALPVLPFELLLDPAQAKAFDLAHPIRGTAAADAVHRDAVAEGFLVGRRRLGPLRLAGRSTGFVR